MAIRTYLENEKKLYEVYVNGFNSRGVRVQRKRNGIETLRKAEMTEFELKRELALLKEERVPFHWEEWFHQCVCRMKVELRPSTVTNYETQLKKWIHPLWKNRELQTINRQEIHQTIYEKIGNDLSDNSKRSILKMVRRIFQMAVEEGIIDRNPCTGVSIQVPEVEQKVLTSSEVGVFLREASITQHRFYPVWVIALMTGMRSGELFALRWTDIDFEAKTISVSKQWTSKNGFSSTKTRRSRVVPISEDLLKFLKEWKLKRGSDEFVLPHLTEWKTGTQAVVTREFCESIGITPIKFHDLRATFITNLLARGESLARVMAIVGHHQLKTTNGYLRRAGVEVQGATERLGYKVPESVSGAAILSFVKK